ncbi:MAG: glycosyltransferase family 2 protein [Bacilli bacterium]|nr:glycosyltransferase family 2 protein [Bacilli bacterium]
MSKKILSVSVASYNVEKFIETALDSYVNCKCKDKLEILIVNDGSTDSTADIVTKYSKKYPGIINLVNQKNAGPGSTVNTGLKNATGKYFRMIDGDDWVNTKDMDSYIEYLENNDVDMVITNYTKVDDKSGKEEKQKLNIEVPYNKIMDFDDICNDLHLDMHNVTYRTDLVKGKLKIDNCFYTDTEYLLFPTEYVKDVVFLENYIYMYRVSLDTQSVNINSLQKHCDMHEMVLDHLMTFFKNNKKSFSESRTNYVARRIANMVGTQLYIYLSYEASDEYKNKIKQMLENLKINNEEIYKIIGKTKTVKLLSLTRYAAYKLLSKKVRKEKQKQ